MNNVMELVLVAIKLYIQKTESQVNEVPTMNN